VLEGSWSIHLSSKEGQTRAVSKHTLDELVMKKRTEG
jgi:hypothetical protein